MSEKEKMYSARAVCRNCHDEKVIDIPFSIPMASYEQAIKCDYCGCDCVLVPLQD